MFSSTRATETHGEAIYGKSGSRLPLLLPERQEIQTMCVVYGADESAASVPATQTNTSPCPLLIPKPKTLTFTSDTIVDDTVATRPEWKWLWRRLFAPRRTDAA
jgi:hypothetical protein